MVRRLPRRRHDGYDRMKFVRLSDDNDEVVDDGLLYNVVMLGFERWRGATRSSSSLAGVW